MPTVRRTKIVVTLGPATDGIEQELVAAGLDVARLNFSHGTPDEHARRCARVRSAAAELGQQVAVMQDLQGPKIRVGRLEKGGPVELRQGQTLFITTHDVVGTAERISCTYAGLPDDVRAGDTILLDDGRLRLSVQAVSGDEVEARVEQGGLLGEHKGINLPGVAVSEPALTETDRQNLRFGIAELDVDYVALSFIRTAAEVREARALVRQLGGDQPLIAKLEKGEAIQNLNGILRAADAVMVARGDLGVELGPDRVPILQKTIIRRANALGMPAITATQMLESMVEAEMPTRAEATDVANAVWDGTDAVMLSEETAAGRNPVQAVRMMDRIVRSAEEAQLPLPVAREASAGQIPAAVPAPGVRDAFAERKREPAAAVTHAAQVLADDLSAKAIIAFTRTGRTGRLLSANRPHVPVYAFSPHQKACRRLALWWGITPVYCTLERGLESNIAAWEAALKSSNLIEPGNTVIIVGSQPFRQGVHTNFLKYHVLART